MYSETLEKLIGALKKMPGIGPKSAQRLAFYILSVPKAEARALTEAILEAKDKIRNCSVCFNLTDNDPCKICEDSSRDKKVLCVVSEPKDLLAIERSGDFRGSYHVLGGVISPLEGIGPEALRIKELLKRLDNGSGVEEVILATNPTTEGEATVIYLNKLIRPLGVKVSRIAYGLPVGSDMDYADGATLSKAMEGRKEI